MKRKGLALMLALASLALVFCAKKMVPPSPDRFAPHLQEIVTRNRSQLELVFDEDMASDRIFADSFVMTGPAGESVKLRGASMGRQADRILLWTPPQQDGLYRVSGVAWDMAGNVTRFRARFRGSVRSDTIRPRVTGIDPAAGSAGLRRGAAVRVRFSEPVDTAAALDFMFVPAGNDTLFKRKWDKDWQAVTFANPDSLPESAIVYFMLLPGVRDLDENRGRSPAFTYFTPDSVFDGAPVKGKAVWRPGPLGTGIVFFNQDTADSGVAVPRTTGLASVLSDGSFATKLRRGAYRAEAVVDTDYDGISDLVSPWVDFSTVQESLKLDMAAETLPRPFSAYRR